MTMLNRRQLLLAAGATLAAPVATTARADDKPLIRILLGLPPGGGTDAIARYIADQLPELLGQPVIIESKVGVGGRLAADALMTAKPDGLTWMVAPNATPTMQTLVFGDKIKWDIWRDFAPVAGLVSYPLGMAVSLQTGATSAKEFIAWAKKNAHRATIGVPGLGGQNAFLAEQFIKQAGLDAPITPYKGTPPLITDLMGGHVPAAVTLMDLMMVQHRAGKVHVIGIFSDKRSELMPGIPTMAEQGVNVASGDGWTAMWAPAGTPKAEITRMQNALKTILARPEVREHLVKNMFVVPDYIDDRAMEKRQRAEIETWRPIIKASGFKPE